jgi:hypothetical protein
MSVFSNPQVVTKRTKNLKKQDIPSLDDPISKLNHVGKETVKKLNELLASAEEAMLELDLPPDLYRCVWSLSICSSPVAVLVHLLLKLQSRLSACLSLCSSVRQSVRPSVFFPAVSVCLYVCLSSASIQIDQKVLSHVGHIGKLNRFGPAAVCSMGDVRGTGLSVLSHLSACRVTKVRQFQKLARLSEADGHMQQKLKQLLKLSKEKWDSACEHAKSAVQVGGDRQTDRQENSL